MLPDFPSLKQKRSELFQEIAYQRSLSRHPILRNLRGIVQHEGDSLSLPVSAKARKRSGYEEFQSKLAFHRDELPVFSDTQVLERVMEMTNDFADQQMKLFLRRVEEASGDGGSVVSSGGKPITEDTVLDMLEASQMDFDGEQVSDGYSFLTGTDNLEILRSLKTTPEGARRHAEILERQRIEWRLREADRKLVD